MWQMSSTSLPPKKNVEKNSRAEAFEIKGRLRTQRANKHGKPVGPAPHLL